MISASDRQGSANMLSSLNTNCFGKKEIFFFFFKVSDEYQNITPEVMCFSLLSQNYLIFVSAVKCRTILLKQTILQKGSNKHKKQFYILRVTALKKKNPPDIFLISVFL